jgi:16S rRNA (guanine527-N7)-methyltransferase
MNSSLPENHESTSLREALEKFSVQLAEPQIELLDQYRQILWEKNEQLNLTRHTTFDKFVSRDLIDSIELAKHLQAEERVIDVGTGGGVPGIVLAVLRPDLKISLCESVNKKSEAIEEIVAELHLPLAVFAGRAEHFMEDFRFDVTVARAVGPLWKMCFWFQDCWVSVGRLLAIKGPNWVNERAEARERNLLRGLNLRCIATYPMPGTESESVILKIWPSDVEEK